MITDFGKPGQQADGTESALIRLRPPGFPQQVRQEEGRFQVLCLA